MQRRTFLKKLFGVSVGAAAMATVPVLAKKDETYTIEDLFDRCEGNGSLYFLKRDSWLNRELIDAMGDRFVDQKYFSYYEPVYNVYLPIKEKYEKRDFESLFLFLKSKKFNYFCTQNYKNEEKGVIKICQYHNEDYYRIDFYAARNPKVDSNY